MATLIRKQLQHPHSTFPNDIQTCLTHLPLRICNFKYSKFPMCTYWMNRPIGCKTLFGCDQEACVNILLNLIAQQDNIQSCYSLLGLMLYLPAALLLHTVYQKLSWNKTLHAFKICATFYNSFAIQFQLSLNLNLQKCKKIASWMWLWKK